MIQDIDFYFPFFILFYGSLMTLITSLPALRKRAEESFHHQLVEQFYSHRALGLICCIVGSLWLLQRLIIA